MMNRKILQGDILDKIKEIPDESIDCIITSPPYYALRDYGTGVWEGSTVATCTHQSIKRKTRAERGGLTELQAGSQGSFGDESQWSSDTCPDCGAIRKDKQIGLEQTPQQYIAKLMQIMTECKRVLKQTGSCWVNIGDSYNGSKIGNTNGTYGQVKQKKGVNTKSFRKIADPTIRIKSKYGIPSRFEIACIDDGWISRNHIPWIKANNMPSSVKDRFTNKWESVFFFTKSQKYYFDLDAVREKCITETKPFNVRVIDTKQTKLTGGMSEKEDQEYDKDSNTCRLHKDRDGNPNTKQDNVLGVDGKPKANYKGFNKRWKNRKWSEDAVNITQTIAQKHSGVYNMETGEPINHPNGKNPGDVFFINPKPYMEAHFATFPVELPKRILKCSCPQNICANCGSLNFLSEDILVHDTNTNPLDNYTMSHLRTIISGVCMQVKKSQIQILFKTMCRYWMEQTPTGNNLQTMWEEILTEGKSEIKTTDLLLQKMLVTIHLCSETKYNLQEDQFKRVLHHLEQEVTKIRVRTQKNNGSISEPSTDKTGSSTSHKRSQNGQQNRESNGNDPSGSSKTQETKKEKNDSMLSLQQDKCVKIQVCSECGSTENRAGITLDPFFGAGTTAVAAEELGLQWIGIDLNPEYIEIAKNRLEKYRNAKVNSDELT